jgi:hypothetical protein
MKITTTPLPLDDAVLVHCDLRGGRINPTDLRTLAFPECEGFPVILCGADDAAIPLAKALAWYRDRCPWVAWYSAPNKGAIVVESVGGAKVVGDLLPLRLPCLICNKSLRAGAKAPFCTNHRQHSLRRQRRKLNEQGL